MSHENSRPSEYSAVMGTFCNYCNEDIIEVYGFYHCHECREDFHHYCVEEITVINPRYVVPAIKELGEEEEQDVPETFAEKVIKENANALEQNSFDS